jgi:hypothetical protein
VTDTSTRAALTVTEIVFRSKRHRKTVEKALRSGELTGFQRAAGCSWRAWPEDVDRWIEGGRPVKRRRSA